MKRALTVAILAALAGSAVADVYSRAYGPKGVVYVNRPKLQWQVWAENGATLEKAWIKLDGEKLEASYDPEKKLASWTPPRNWAPGEYTIEMGVSTDDGLTVKKNWKIQIQKAPILTDASQESEAVVECVNDFRNSIGLPPAHRMTELELAAHAHAQYLIANSITGHYQSAGNPGFTGATPSDRLNAFGYVGGSSEVVHFGRASVDESVESLIAAPYHRFAFMTPGRLPMGSAYGSQRLVIDFGEGDGSQTLVYPYDGQSDVPTSWTGRERPNPLRLHSDIQSAPGYPIVFGRFSSNPYKLQLVNAELVELDSGDQVSCGINHPGNDEELSDAIILIPKRPLKSQTAYRATVECRGESGEKLRRTWKFRTSR